METRINFIANGIVERVDLYAIGVASLNATIQSHQLTNVTHETLQTFSDAQNYPQRYKGARGFGLIKPIQKQDIAAFVEQASTDRPDQRFQISRLSEHDKTRYIIQYIFPENINTKAIGLDIGSEANRRNTAERAALDNKTSLTAPITLVQESGKSLHGFLLLQPLYKGQAFPSQISEITEYVYAWTYAPLLIEEILTTVTQVGQDKLAITDTQEETPFFQSQLDTNTVSNSVSKSVAIYGRTWQIELFATPTFLKALNLPHPYVGLINGVLLTSLVLLLYILLYLTVQKRAQKAQYLINLAKAREVQLSQTNDKLASEVNQKTSELEHLHLLNDSILTSASYSIIATDQSGIIKSFNPAAESLLGYAADDLIDKHSPSLFHLESEVIERAQALSKEYNEDIQPGFDVFVVKAQKQGIDKNQWTYVSKAGQHIQVQLSVTALTDSRGHPIGYLGIAYDLTENLQNEKALKEAKLRAEQASQAKSDFLANMSHEIRTPLNGIFGTVQILKDKALDADCKTLLSTAYISTQSLITIVNDILDFSKIEASKLLLDNREFSLSTLIEQLNSELSLFSHEKSISLTFTVDIQDDFWCGDVVRIRQVLINLISNGIKFTEKGGVDVRVEQIKSNELKFTISDTGVGIQEAHLSRLFNRFEQGDASATRKKGGTGLGLAITKGLLDLMKGSITVCSSTGTGTTVTVTLPLAPADNQALSDIIPKSNMPNMTGKVILIVEDNEINQTITSTMLEPTGAKILVATDGKQGVNAFRKHKPDIILMDIQMPVMDGVTACNLIKTESPSQVVIALTANVVQSERAKYEKFFDGCLSKPTLKEDLIAELHRHLR